MNEQQPYEKHFSEKMRELPVPDPNRTWKQMHAILDKEMPPGSGSGGMGGAGTRWWMIGVGAGIIFAGTWFSGSHFMQKGRQKSPVATLKPINDSTALENNSAYLKNVDEDSSTLIVTDSSRLITKQFPAASTDKENAAGNNATPAHDEAGLPANSTHGRSLPSASTAKKEENRNPGASRSRLTDAGSVPVASHKKGDGAVAKSSGRRGGANQPAAAASRGTNNNHVPPATGRGNDLAKNNKPDRPPGAASQGNGEIEKDGSEITSKTDRLTDTNNRNRPAANTKSFPDSKPDEDQARSSTVRVNTAYTVGNAIPAYDIFDEVMDNDYAMSSLPVRTERVTRPSRYTRMRQEDDRAFVGGLTLPITVPIGDQHGSPHNINASRGNIADYMPMPHFQYHFNSKWYAQAELQMISPQPIPEICFNQRLAVMGPSAAYFSYNAEKLYYFSLPLSIHYSPVPHLYVGTGLQYSHFISGVMGIKQAYAMLPAGPVGEYKDYVKFSNPRGPALIRPDEWRLLFDVNFYINRFTIGMRYNRSLSNYAMVHVPGTDDHTSDVNKAFQFYLRYDLFETFHNKGKAGLAKMVGLR